MGSIYGLTSCMIGLPTTKGKSWRPRFRAESDGDLFITATQQDNGNEYFFAARVMPADDEGTVLVTRATLVNGLLAPSLGSWHCANTHDAITSVLQWMNV